MGEFYEKAWDILRTLSPSDVSCRTVASYDASSGTYILPVFNQGILVSPNNREIQGATPVANFLVSELRQYSRLSILWYLIEARDIIPSGNLINPSHMSDGLMFGSGTHALPLDRLATRYASDAQSFIRKGIELGGQQLELGNASIKLLPFPRIPVVFILWISDEEFPARTSLLFDSTCRAHLPVDILWATAMMSLLIMLR